MPGLGPNTMGGFCNVEPRRKFDTQAGHAYETLRRRILNREFALGQRLVLRQLAAELGTSVIPVRDALAQLETERLVVGRAGRGWEVVSLSTLDINQVCVVREALESESARLCAQTAGVEDIAHLRSIAEELELLLRDAGKDPLELEWRFHASVAGITGCHLLRQEIERTLVVRFVETTPFGLGIPHGVVVDAIAAGDPDEAERVMRDHLRATQEHLLSLLGPK